MNTACLRQGSLGWKFIYTPSTELHQASICSFSEQMNIKAVHFLQVAAWSRSPFQLGLVGCASLGRLQCIK